MNREEVLNAFKEGRFDLQEALDKIDESYYQNVGHSTIDFDREARTGAPEVIFGSGKTAQQIADIVDALDIGCSHDEVGWHRCLMLQQCRCGC